MEVATPLTVAHRLATDSSQAASNKKDSPLMATSMKRERSDDSVEEMPARMKAVLERRDDEDEEMEVVKKNKNPTLRMWGIRIWIE